jgi:UDP-N-acetylmuramate dehydrogenase
MCGKSANGISAADRLSDQWLIHRFGHLVRFDEPMAAHTSFKTGGPADVYVSPANIGDLRDLIRRCRDAGVDYAVIGGGTNLLVRDRGFRGVVISLLQGFKTIALASDNTNGVIINAMSGVTMAALCAFALKNGLSGFNFALGIPGTVGGGVRMNAGTKYGSAADVLDSVRFLTPDGEIRSVSQNQFVCEYRKFSVRCDPEVDIRKAIIIDAAFRVQPTDPKALRRDAETIVRERKISQPVGKACAGCFFKNPPGLSAGQLIDQAGLKGKQAGGAQVSFRHANFIVNHCRASSQDVMDLAEMVRNTVYHQFGVQLETEVNIIGE